MAARTQRREEIRQAAIALFAQKGFYGSAMEDIATSLGMGTSSLYNHWQSKQSLLAGIMIHTMTALNELFDNATVDGTVPQRLERAMITHVRYHGTHPLEVRIGNREITSLREPEKKVDYWH